MKIKRMLLVSLLVAALAGAWFLFGMGRDPLASLSGPPRKGFDFSRLPVTRAPEGTPNVILISIDSLRADHLGCYGYPRDTSPHIDRLAREGALFEYAIASTSWTLPSHMSMFTSLYDSLHGVEDSRKRLVIDHPLLAEVMKEAGYRTAGFYSGPLLHPGYGFVHGFEEYVNCTSYPWAGEQEIKEFVAQRRKTRSLAKADITNPRIYEKVTGWMEEKMKEPFFLFIHYWDVHYDYIPPDPYDKMFDPGYEGELDVRELEGNESIHADMARGDLEHLIALYDGEIRWTDEWIGRLMEMLRTKGLLDRTLIVLTADHGEEFFEHGAKGHGKSLYDETIRVPLIVRLPGVVEAGLRISQQVRTIDIYPTVLDIARVGAGTLRHCFVTDAFQFLRNVIVVLAWGARLVTGDLFQQLGLRVASKWLTTNE